LWILAAFAALIAVFGVAGWGLLRDPGGSGVPRDAGGAPVQPPEGIERAQPPDAKRVEVPMVEGLAAREARERLVDAGFDVSVRSQESPEESSGKVLAQSVAGEKRANKGSKILLTVGEGLRVATAPNLVGLTYSEAENELERAGLLLGGVKEVSSATVPAGVIVDQSPPGGTTLDPDSYVYLTTSVGPPGETTYVP
jgi:serine/threonine-protein kinase